MTHRFYFLIILLRYVVAQQLVEAYCSPRQSRSPHQPLVHGAGALAAFADGPDDEGLAAAHVAGNEYAGDGGVVSIGTLGEALNVAASIELDAPNKMGVLFCFFCLMFWG